MGQVVCVWYKARSSVWRRRVFCMVGVVVVIMVVDSNRVVCVESWPREVVAKV